MNTPSDLVILGGGGFAKEVAAIWIACQEAGQSLPQLRGFVAPAAAWAAWQQFPYLGDDAWAKDHLDPARTAFVVGVGTAKLREEIANQYECMGFSAIGMIHPTAQVGLGSQIGAGTIICPGSILAIDVTLGRHILCNLQVGIGHDTVIGDYSVLSPGVHLSGNTHIGLACELGTGACTIPGVRIGPRSVIGAGAVVTRDLDGSATYVGVPARPLGGKKPSSS